MKRTLLFLCFAFIGSIITNAQKAEVLYFKADLPCCQARACNNLEAGIRNIIESYYKDGSVVFKTVKLSDPANKELIDRFSAKSQTVIVICSKKRGKESVTDISEIVRSFARSYDTASLEKDLVAVINEGVK